MVKGKKRADERLLKELERVAGRDFSWTAESTEIKVRIDQIGAVTTAGKAIVPSKGARMVGLAAGSNATKLNSRDTL